MHYRKLRNYGCRITDDLLYKGYPALILENERIRILLLPGKGSDIIEFLYKPLDVDITWRTEQAFRPIGTASGFIETYEGGWQEVFPNGGAPVQVLGVELSQHDEVAGLPWDYVIVEDTPECIAVKLSVETAKLPFRIEKILRLTAGSSVVEMSETATNLSPETLPAMWGHHLAYGFPFLQEGCVIELPRGTKVTPHATGTYPNGRRVKPGRVYDWPWVEPSDVSTADVQSTLDLGGEFDLSIIPPKGTSSDIVYLHSFETGAYTLKNPKHQLAVQVQWDKEMFPYLWYWQEFGKGYGYPWFGRHYNIGLEPFSSYPTNGLVEAIANQSALTFAPYETKSAWLTVEICEMSSREE